MPSLSPPERLSPHESLPPLLQIHRPRVLVVEDDLDLRTILERVVRSIDPDLVIDWATNVVDARNLLGARDYRLILADYRLDANGSGLSLRPYCRWRQPSAPFAMMSALTVEDYLRSVGRQPCPFLRKPFSVEECRTFLSSLLA